MPRISLYKPEKGKDYKFIDRTVYEMFQIGGVDVNVYKYIGTTTIDDQGNIVAKDHTQIQDLVLLENRDRKYDSDVYTIRGHYRTQDIDFNLSQFGLFLQNDTVFMTIHINSSVDALGRKVMPGDVFEIPNLREEYTVDRNDLSNFAAAIKKFYVVEDINRAAEGFSATWYPHLYRVKLKPIVDSQEFKDILDKPANEDSNATLRDLLSTYEIEKQINAAVLTEAEADARLSGFETSHFYTLAVDPNTGRASVETVDNSLENINASQTVSEISVPPVRDGYTGYLTGDGLPPNGEQFGFGLQFPPTPKVGDTFLRTDYLPNRLFRYDGARWVKLEDNVRMTLSNTDTRQTLKTSFVNNTQTSGIGKLASDIIIINGTNSSFDSNITVEVIITSVSVYIKTNITYQEKYLIEAWLNEDSQAVSITKSNSAGKLAFTINHSIAVDTRLRYTIYDNIVEQRQPITKALKIKPIADE